ncbi:ABC transporter ATP-binding protein [Proteinivorax tanatarense]|uniref:ABC transporter ATP-binding protein n=1 Tax=Proteinivorax tanatarense TaxID=1260629 RepID=A0AAU7VN80_9FIRM
MKTVIGINNLSKVFSTKKKKNVHALKNINLNVKEHEFVCILGPSGSGKSTLLRLMEGLIKPTSGKITVMDKEIRESILDTGMVFQDYSLLPWKNVIDNVSFGLELRKMSRKERYKISIKILDKFGLGEFTTSYPHELSGGMKQRVAIARSIATSPKILYMDEPFGALDAYTRFHMQKDLIDFWIKEKRTVVFVTHSVEEAIFLGTRVILMSPRPGEIVGDYKIDLPYPRNRWSENFKNLFQQIMSHLDEVSEQYKVL